MEFDSTNFKENPHFHQSFSLQNPSEPQMENGFLMGSSPSKGFYQSFTNFDQVSNTENSFSNFPFGNLTPFHDPFDPFIASSSTPPSDQCGNFFPTSESKNPSGSNGVKMGLFMSYPPRILLRSLNTEENSQKLQQMQSNASVEVPCLNVEDMYQAKDNLEKKKQDLTKESEKTFQNSPILVKGQWSPEEDRLLVQLVNQYGERKWSLIAEMLNGRMGKQCRERWHNHLRPGIKKDRWTEEEEMILIEAHKKMGNKWAAIARELPGRSENTVKNHWNAAKRRRFTTKRKCKYNSLLRQYIMSLSSPDQSSEMLHFKDQMEPTNCESDHNSKAVDGSSELGQSFFGYQVFDKIAELGREIGLGVEEMDLLEMVRQGII